MKKSGLKNRKTTNDIFTSKADVLKFLQSKISKSKIENIFDFTVSEWRDNEKHILEQISKTFNSQTVIIRSSAIGEDTVEKSQAGSYVSILNVKSSSKLKLKNAINLVIKSYIDKNNINPKNQILIQKQSFGTISSGVIFTRSEDIGSPYYIINYDEGAATDNVTKGYANNTIKIFRKTPAKNLAIKWRSLLQAIQEIESILKTDTLDIEFGITKSNKIIVFQVRPMTSILDLKENLENKIELVISDYKHEFVKLIKPNRIFGKRIFYSDMADWNPSEIIGNNPNLLDYSLYEYLIMSDAWQIGRSKIGYQNVIPLKLMKKFGNKPYVDVRASFNSLIPNKIKKRLKNKLINYYFDKLQKNPQLHDKVEFEILFTCYDLALDERLKELRYYGFTNEEIKEIKMDLLDSTNEIVNGFNDIFDESSKSIIKMDQSRKKILGYLDSTDRNYYELLYAAKKLLDDCKLFGTIPFSTMARIAFIGSTLLKSLEKRKYVSHKFIESFMNSIITPLSEFQNDCAAYLNNELSKEQFLKKYGHLRSGTYDMLAPRYDMEDSFLDGVKFIKNRRIETNINGEKISNVLAKHLLNFQNIDFFSFVKNALVQREKLKFEFTRNLSDAIELIAEAGEKLGFSRTDIVNLNIEDILKINKNEKSLKNLWSNKIEQQKKIKLLYDHLVLPPIIFSDEDFEIINYYISKPNYITTKKVTADLRKLTREDKKTIDLENKIILIDSADPGYDWIFTKNPAGLITKYGGVASHMAIRCAESGIPAAIGCGEILFEKLLWSTKISLDCGNEQIIILEHERKDAFVEEKKVLKSLGYIK